eukprot:6193129-Pleurochrysis_carterae.AAC.1
MCARTTACVEPWVCGCARGCGARACLRRGASAATRARAQTRQARRGRRARASRWRAAARATHVARVPAPCSRRLRTTRVMQARYRLAAG